MKHVFVVTITLLFVFATQGFSQSSRDFAGTIVTARFESVPNAVVEIIAKSGKQTAISDRDGRFRLAAPTDSFVAKVSGKNIEPTEASFDLAANVSDVVIKIEYLVPPIAESVTITSDALSPNIEYRNDAIYKNQLFGRDDQIIQTLNAGINAGQHEGGGKSLEIRRYGFNTDHGGVNGGIKILVDDVQQNQGTQGHGQGYLGGLKSLSPELVEGVSIINGPFSPAFGDFSGLGVVQINLRESLPTKYTLRVQGGSHNTFRGFFAISPQWKKVDAFLAYEPSYTDGPFISPLEYRRDNISGNVTFKLSNSQSIGIKTNLGRNNFFSSGQIPLDLVASGELDRFGFIDPENGGQVRQGNVSAYYRNESASGATLRANAFVGRSLFDLYSNFTFFAADPVYGDEIQQHDSRLQQGANFQYLRPYKLFGGASLLTLGGNLLANQVNVSLYPTVSRVPNRKFLPGNEFNPDVIFTAANASITNYAGYVQNSFSFADGHLRVDLGLRFDRFNYDIDGFELRDTRTDLKADEGQSEFQPKVAISWSPLEETPISFYANYGRGISSQDARGVAREPGSPKVSITDFYQAGASYNGNRVSAVLTSFLIDRSNEQVYIPDDGSIELAGPTRSYGIEARTSVKITKNLSFNGGLTRVIKSFYRGEFTAGGERVVVDSSPRIVANAGFVLSEFFGFNSSLAWRHISNYRLDGEDPSIKASGHDVVDLAISKRLRKWVDLNVSIDNLFNKNYYETQNFLESRTCGTCDLRSRIHATPGYPFTVSVGMTFRFGNKN